MLKKQSQLKIRLELLNAFNTLFRIEIKKLHRLVAIFIIILFSADLNYSADQWYVLDTSNSPLPSDQINDLAFDQNGGLWIATNHGVAHFYNNQWEIFNSENSIIPDKNITSVAVDKQNHVWIGLGPKGEFIELPNEHNYEQKQPWGFLTYDQANWIHFTKDNTDLRFDIVKDIVVDDNGSIYIGIAKKYDDCGIGSWIGSWTGGEGAILKINGSEWTYLYSGDKEIWAMAVDKDILWVGLCRNTLLGFQGGDIKYHLWLSTGSYEPPVKAFAVDSKSNLWASHGYDPYPVWVYDRNRKKGLLSEKLWHNAGHGNSLAIDRNDNKYIGNKNGIIVYTGDKEDTFPHPYFNVDDKKVTIYNTKNSRLPTNSVNVLKFDSGGNLWIGTQKGLALWLKGTANPGIENPVAQLIPHSIILNQNTPNPFNSNTTIQFSLLLPGLIQLNIYNIRGQRVKTMINDFRDSGDYTVNWNGYLENGRKAVSGIYFYQLIFSGSGKQSTQTGKMVLCP